MIGRWTTARRRLTITLAASAVAVGAAATSAAADQVIDANADPKGAAKAMDSAPMVYTPQYDSSGKQTDGIWKCDPQSNCKYQDQTDNDKPQTRVVTEWGPETLMGDGGYNCADGDNDDATMEVGTQVEQEAVQSTELEESIKLKTSLGFLGLAETSAELEAFTKQAASFSTSITMGNAVNLPPLYKGFLSYQVMQATVKNGTVSWLDPIGGLITVENLDFSFPGYRDEREDPNSVQFIQNKMQMTDDELTDICHQVTGVTPTRKKAPSFMLTTCAAGGCDAVRVNGMPPGQIRRGTVVVRDTVTGRSVARGSVSRGGIRLDRMTRPLASGDSYKLIIKEPKKRFRHSPGNYATLHNKTQVPITIR